MPTNNKKMQQRRLITRVKQVVAIVVTVLVGLIARKYEDKSSTSDHQSIPLLHCRRRSIIQTVRHLGKWWLMRNATNHEPISPPLRSVVYIQNFSSRTQKLQDKIEHRRYSAKSNVRAK